jgi:hypothetical protein
MLIKLAWNVLDGDQEVLVALNSHAAKREVPT